MGQATGCLDIKHLLDSASEKLALLIRGRSAEELRYMFNEPNDFSWFEKQRVLYQYGCLDPSKRRRRIDTELWRPDVIRWCMADFKNLPLDLKWGVWRYCEKEDILQLLLMSRQFHGSIIDSPWWCEHLAREIGAVGLSAYPSWRRAYLAYQEGTVPIRSRFWPVVKIIDKLVCVQTEPINTASTLCPRWV